LSGSAPVLAPYTVKIDPKAGPSVPARDAATLILVDRQTSVPRVLMGKRHGSHAFMPNKYVFPGGRLDAADRMMAPADNLADRCSRRLRQHVTKWTETRSRALAMAAIRETCEETGILIGKREDQPVTSASEAWAAFVAAQVRPKLSALTFVARAITPPKRPRRFDTRFFFADRSQVAVEIGSMAGPEAELITNEWLTFDEALEQELPNITRVVIKEIAARLETGEIDRPVPFYFFRNGKYWRKELD
jgi:8-oxo-dGTP pyrophosphatase MutT (NUDIX family)